MTPLTEYFDTAVRLLSRAGAEQRENIEAAGRLVAEALETGGILHVFGAGHSHLIAEEAFYRAGGLAAVNPILDARLTFLHGVFESTRAERRSGYAREVLEREDVRRGDAGIVVSNSGRNAVPVEMAEALRARGVRVVAITSRSAAAAGDPAGTNRLAALADITIDTGVPPGDAVVTLPGLDRRMGPVSTVVAAAVMHGIAIAAASLLSAGGRRVPVLPSANVGGTTEDALRSVLQPYADRVRYIDLPREEEGA